MKTVDENYSFDELEGFEVVRSSSSASKMRSELVQLHIHDSTFILSDAAVDILQDPDYIRCMINPERKLLLVFPTTAQDLNGIQLRKRSPKAERKAQFDSRPVKRAVEKLTKRDSAVVNLIADGKKTSAKPKAVIFDMNALQTYEKKPSTWNGRRAKK